MGRVLVTGMGMISAIGNNVRENHESLRAGRSGIGKVAWFESLYASQLPFGEVRMSNEALKAAQGLESAEGYTRTCLLADKAFTEAITDAGLTLGQLSSLDTALISASTVGGMCLTDQLYEDANHKSEGSEYLESYGCSAHTLKLIKRYRIKGFTDTINTACSSSANAIMLGARLIRSGRVKRAIVGGVDSLAKYTVNGFNALKILSDAPCKPFDMNRNGLNLGEGAAYLVLEAEELTAGKKIYAEVAGFGNANDAHHPSAMSDEATGAIRCMHEAIRSAGITPGQIGYVNAHGTGTQNNDQVEFFGMGELFEVMPPYSSTKSFTGHTLGAAGAVEAIFSILGIANGELFPSLNVSEPINGSENAPVTAFQGNYTLNYVLSNSFGFGGNCTSLVFAGVN
ncbi:beta-ACP synthase [Dyadobacter beijingensis]|uniref:Beta-ACP synthase n=1 Tax=Dyadobacter beijingensis TaxID=365489 RepID=A0ABQ2HM08_9BACT|nr:beta-ketoacyl-[acyl-carrier-protein] synthase family protein [Dyadobacter beijingensis]GGM85862.1 beta-ACP synthase [Dyadobacter beijingensis]